MTPLEAAIAEPGLSLLTYLVRSRGFIVQPEAGRGERFPSAELRSFSTGLVGKLDRTVVAGLIDGGYLIQVATSTESGKASAPIYVPALHVVVSIRQEIGGDL